MRTGRGDEDLREDSSRRKRGKESREAKSDNPGGHRRRSAKDESDAGGVQDYELEIGSDGNFKIIN